MAFDVVRVFSAFGEQEANGSPRYAALGRAVAARPDLAAALHHAPPAQQRANLLFAAVQYLLRTAMPDHPLAGHYPTLGGTGPADDTLVDAFADLVTRHHDALARLCATRKTQTNEAGRAALLRPAFAHTDQRLADGRPLALVELGSSAGILLVADRFAYTYNGRRVGRTDAALTLRCDLDGDAPVDAEPVFGRRIGIDRDPLDAADPDAVAWLRSCVWPERTDRLATLDLALAEVRAAPPTVVTGDFRAALPGVLDGVPADHLPVVFASNALTYLTPAGRRDVAQALAVVGARRDLAVVVNEASSVGVRVFAASSPAPPGQTMTLVRWRDGTPTVTALARTEPHGAWLSWAPRDLPYRVG